jgi:hypothetical protein
MQARKAHSLIGQVYDRRSLRLAWERVKKNKGAGGVDGVTIARFDENQEHYLDVLYRQLKDGRYRPRPVKRVEIDKPGTGKKRPLGIPTVMDRVCQQALVQVLAPIFEPTFQEASFGYRLGRSTHTAMRRIWRQLGQAEWIVDGDISDFFGSLSHERLIDLVADRVADGKVLSLTRSMLTAGVLSSRGSSRLRSGRSCAWTVRRHDTFTGPTSMSTFRSTRSSTPSATPSSHGSEQRTRRRIRSCASHPDDRIHRVALARAIDKLAARCRRRSRRAGDRVRGKTLVRSARW